MLCLLVEIGITIWGIVTIIRARISVTSSKVVVGMPARAIGIVMTLTLPVVFGIGVIIGVVMASRGGVVRAEDLQKYAVHLEERAAWTV